jgi:predicted DsbA family dithiol-disulfide isomerase
MRAAPSILASKGRVPSGLAVAGLAVAALVLPARPVTADELRPRPQHVVVTHDDPGQVPIVGPRHAPVTIDFFLSLGTERTLRLHRELSELSRRHPRRLRVVYRLVESGRTMLAEAVLEAFAQGRFVPFLDRLADFAQYHRRMPIRGPELLAVCERAGVDYRRVEDAWADSRHLPLLEESELYRRRRRAHRAPALLFNGVMPGLRTNLMDLDRLETSYDLAYASARQKLDEGVPLEHLYELSLREVDAADKPMTITAGGVDGVARPERRGLLKEAPLVKTPPGGHSIGPADAVITVRFYCNFLSTHCALLKRSLDELRTYYPTELRLVFHHMIPQELGEDDVERDLVLMHQAALCADAQGVFWRFYDSAYRDYLHRRQRAMVPGDQLDEIIADTELDRERYQRCMADPKKSERMHALVRAAVRAGITQTPTVVIGGRMYPGSKSFLELRSLVDQELLPGLLERFAPTLEQERAAQPRPRP